MNEGDPGVKRPKLSRAVLCRVTTLALATWRLENHVPNGVLQIVAEYLASTVRFTPEFVMIHFDDHCSVAELRENSAVECTDPADRRAPDPPPT
eukprot:TRINITY_DN15564_c0_g1_i1.p1 TRINITY_DN15564_c0_g1~~TRINITY_DN15564_c0_g1_i1.p1  ORF type:complete len:105 (+),score=9.38 TRINITY_DN15564_c0_g1_i1:35-316(+)